MRPTSLRPLTVLSALAASALALSACGSTDDFAQDPAQTADTEQVETSQSDGSTDAGESSSDGAEESEDDAQTSTDAPAEEEAAARTAVEDFVAATNRALVEGSGYDAFREATGFATASAIGQIAREQTLADTEGVTVEGGWELTSLEVTKVEMDGETMGMPTIELTGCVDRSGVTITQDGVAMTDGTDTGTVVKRYGTLKDATGAEEAWKVAYVYDVMGETC